MKKEQMELPCNETVTKGKTTEFLCSTEIENSQKEEIAEAKAIMDGDGGHRRR